MFCSASLKVDVEQESELPSTFMCINHFCQGVRHCCPVPWLLCRWQQSLCREGLPKPAQVCCAEWFVSVHWCWESILRPSGCFLLLERSWMRSTEQRKVGVCKSSLVPVWCCSLPCWCLSKHQCRGVVVGWEEGMSSTFVMLDLLFDKAKLWSRYRIIGENHSSV